MLLVKSIWSQECSINRDFKLAVPKKTTPLPRFQY